jgi:adenylate cyclase
MALAGFAVVLAATGWWLLHRKSPPISIAVLPLENLGHEPANDYFADGLTDELIRNLSVIEGLEVRSRTSSFAWKGKSRDVQEAGRQLRAEYILEGSVLRDRQQLRINAQLIRVRDDFPLWSGRYDRELPDAVAIQDEISRGIVNGLRLKLGRGRRRYDVNADAYDLYLRARSLELRRGFTGLSNSVDAFSRVIAKDPSFAPAYAGLAAAHAARSGQFRSNFGDEITRMRTAAEKAIQLDPLLPEAHAALGMAFARDGQWEICEKSFRHAISLDPNRSESHRDLAKFFFEPLGRGAEAIEQLRLAEKADPLAPDVHNLLSAALISAGRYDEAAQHCDKLPPDYWGKTECLGNVRLQQGRTNDAIRILETPFNGDVWKGSERWGALGAAYVRAGRSDDAEKLAAESPFNPFNQARIYAALGDKDRTFEALDRASMAGPFRIGRALTFPYYALLKGDPRLKALRKKVGLPE